MTETRRVVLIELAGGAVDVLRPLFEAAVMPNLAALLRTSAVGRLCHDAPPGAAAAWATFRCGVGPGRHGVLDEAYLDPRRGVIRPVSRRPLPCPTLDELLARADSGLPAVRVADVPGDPRLWQTRPGSFDELAAGTARTVEAIDRAVAAAKQADRAGPWRLLSVRFGLLDPLLHRLWSTLGLGDAPGANRRWVAKAREAFGALDLGLGRLGELAAARDAALVLVSPFGFVPFREKITVNELLCRRGLLHLVGGTGRIGYRVRRLAWRARRAVLGDGACRPVRAWLPIDWRRSRAVSLHGQGAALVYLNTPERFGIRSLATPRQHDQAAADAMAALSEARHPASGEPLFEDVYRTADRYACAPFFAGLPEIVGIPSPGFLVRHRPDRNGHLLRTDPSLAATRSSEGTLILHGPGIAPCSDFAADLADVAPTILRLLGLPPGEEMSGRAVDRRLGRPGCMASV
jgi:predicted AlkP superfamily phosphohydrolase/phosphomutase